jgi:hypothetical protein
MWHGTKSLDPAVIFNSDRGFDHAMGHTGGMFGPGIYFSENAYYSHANYGHTVPASELPANEVKGAAPLQKIFLARVLAGDYKDFGSQYHNIRRPPEKAPFQKDRLHEFYDSVGMYSCM